jgi:hypothetical protein
MSKSKKFKKGEGADKHSAMAEELRNCKGGPMRDRRERRPKDFRNSWKAEEQF